MGEYNDLRSFCSSTPTRFFDFKDIEVNEFGGALQQVRFPPTRLAIAPGDARNHLFMLPGATYVDPELSWKYESGPARTTFVSGTALGAKNEGTLWTGSSRSFQQVGGTGGSLYRLKLSRNRRKVDVSDPKLAEGVVDNLAKFGVTENESLIVGRGSAPPLPSNRGPSVTSTSSRLRTARFTRSARSSGYKRSVASN